MPTMPWASRWLSGIEPQPMRVEMTGTSRYSARATRSPAASALMTPPPAMSSGCSAASSMSRMRSAWVRDIVGTATGSGS